MIIKELDFTELNREEWINVIQSILYWFRLEYSYFTELEKEIIKETLDKTIYERNEKI